MHWLPKSVGRSREGKFKHARIFLHDPVNAKVSLNLVTSISSLSISSPGSVTNLDIMLPGPPPKPKKQKKLSVASSSYDQVGREKSQRSCYVG